jgi:hypothetical protein
MQESTKQIDGKKYCMDFMNIEIFDFLINPLKKYPQLNIYILDDDDNELTGESKESIRFITFDGHPKKTEFYIAFYGWKTVIFLPLEWNCDFAFIDENMIEEICTQCDISENVRYDGTLHNKTHKEILELLLEFIVILMGVQNIRIKCSHFPYKNFSNVYTINISKEKMEKREIIFENIKFVIN